MIHVGSTLEIRIEDISNEGHGIGKAEGMALFVRDTLPGDLVCVYVSKLKKNYGFAEKLLLVEPSPDRILAACPFSTDCGGCSFQQLSYNAQLKTKEKQVRDKLTRLAGIENPLIRPIIGMDETYRYRNKAVMQIAEDGSVGFYKAKSHDVIDCETCLLQTKAAEAAADALRDFIKTDHISVYDPVSGKGLLRNMIVRTSWSTGEIMVVLVINGKGIPNAEKLVRMMDDRISDLEEADGAWNYSLESVHININKKPGSEILGEQSILIAGKQVIIDKIGHLKFEISSMSFYQVNPTQMERLYEKALDYACLTGTETVLDLYCGVGTIGLLASSKAKKVIGIESVRGAVIDANRNAVINGIVNATYICGEAENELPKLLQEEGFTADVAILDPPRIGCDPALLEAVAAAEVKRIVYVSCDPATMARDIRILGSKGYRFMEATPVDMFPWTSHCESVVKLEKCKTQ